MSVDKRQFNAIIRFKRAIKSGKFKEYGNEMLINKLIEY